MEGIASIIKTKSDWVNSLKARKKGHFTMVYNEFICSEDFTIYEKMVFIVLNKYLMRHKTCWPNFSTISKSARCGETSVKKAIKGLVSKGMISIDRGNGRRSNTYSVLKRSP